MIAEAAEAGDGADTDRSDDGGVTEFLTLVDIGHMYLHHRKRNGGDGIAQGISIMGKGTGIENNTVILQGSLVYAVDENALVIRLNEIEGDAERGCRVVQNVVDFVESSGAVNVRLTQAGHIKIRSVED